MNFSEKLTELLTLTGTKNAQLADALGIGRPYMSRLKTGDRKPPNNRQIIRDMATYFAARCTDDYRRGALAEFTSDPRLNTAITESMLAEVLYDYLTNTSPTNETPTGHFLSNFELYVPGDPEASGSAMGGVPPAAYGMAAYYKNAGRRQALKDMFAYIDSIDAPHAILLFTDEDYGWLVEDAAFGKWLNAELRTQTERNVSIERIQPPFTDVEFTFSSIERWLPGYMAGVIQQYYYPFPRDRLHRRTVFVIPGHIALYSVSVYGEGEPPLTLLTRDPSMVDVCARQYAAIKKRCRPAIITCNAASECLFSATEAVAAIDDVGVYKTDALSINTLPPEIIARIRRHGTPFAKRLAESFDLRAQARAKVLLNHTITDIMHLPDFVNVIVGKEPIPGTSSMPDGPLYYTVEEYRLHLARILWYLEVYRNYRAVFTDDPMNRNVVMFIKGEERALLVKTTAPFAVFDVTEPTMATAFCDYLRRIAEEKSTPFARRATVERINVAIRRLDDATH